MCRTLGISTSGFYDWLYKPLSLRGQKTVLLRTRISELYKEHKGCAGSPTITADLRSEVYFANISRPRVARHMKNMGLRCRSVKKFVVTTDSKHDKPIAPNLLDRQFTVDAKNSVWVSDITYLKVGTKWNYLSVFIDLYSRAVVGWDLSDSLGRSSLLKAFSKAVQNRKPPQGLMVHSDRGVQYASDDFRKALQKNKCIQSMSRKGNCWDNAVAESFFHTLKGQCVRQQKFNDIEEANLILFDYIEIYYNRRRRHSTNGWLSPADFEEINILQLVA